MLDNLLMGDFEREQISERLGKLKGGLCIVKSGGLSEVEMQECRDRVEDALFAVKAALEDGYVQGAGMALFQAAKECQIQY
jgi:chaperonin GroEL